MSMLNGIFNYPRTFIESFLYLYSSSNHRRITNGMRFLIILRQSLRIANSTVVYKASNPAIVRYDNLNSILYWGTFILNFKDSMILEYFITIGSNKKRSYDLLSMVMYTRLNYEKGPFTSMLQNYLLAGDITEIQYRHNLKFAIECDRKYLDGDFEISIYGTVVKMELVCNENSDFLSGNESEFKAKYPHLLKLTG